MWILFSIFAAFFESTKDYLASRNKISYSGFERPFALSFYSLLILTPLLLISGIPHIDWKPFLLASLFSLLITPIHLFLYFKSLALSPVSDSIPMMAFNPVFTWLMALVFSSYRPSIVGILGIIFVSLGIYISKLKKIRTFGDLFVPIKTLIKDRGLQYMLIVALVLAVGINTGKMRVNASSPPMSAFTGAVVSSISLYIILKIKSKGKFKTGWVINNFQKLSLIGIISGLSVVSTGFALEGGYTPFVSSIKRTNILGSQITGKYLLGEKVGALKIIGNIILFTGVVLIIIFN